MSTETNEPNQDAIADEWAQALEEQAATTVDEGAPAFEADNIPVKTASGGAQDIQMVLDIPVQLSVELGRTRVPIKYITCSSRKAPSWNSTHSPASPWTCWSTATSSRRARWWW